MRLIDTFGGVNHNDQMRAFYDQELQTRTGSRLGSPRQLHLEEFVDACVTGSSPGVVIEVGSGAGHDGAVMRNAGLGYIGVDLSGVGARLGRIRGLTTVQASATALPFADDVFDAGWSMSTLMHLPDEDIVVALKELRRVIRPGGLLEVGVWGDDNDGVWVDDQGRYFRQRTDLQIRELMSHLGDLVAFETWDRLSHGVHYQWSRVLLGDRQT